MPVGHVPKTMKPSELGQKYDKIAAWWDRKLAASDYGTAMLKRAIDYRGDSRDNRSMRALDVGCGSGGRLVSILDDRSFSITGLDVSQKMVALARQHHPEHTFLHQDVCTWYSDQRFDLILAWDSIFHLPLDQQKPVLNKLCDHLVQGGVLIYTLGDTQGEHTDRWREDTFYYSSIGVNENIQLLLNSGLQMRHLELDQYPERHACIIASRP